MEIKFLLLRNTKTESLQMMVIYSKKLIKKFQHGGVEKPTQQNLIKLTWMTLCLPWEKMLLFKQPKIKFLKNNLLN